MSFDYLIIIFFYRFSSTDERSEPVTLKIGSHNVFEVYSTIDGVQSIGDNNIFETKSLFVYFYMYICI